MEQMIGLDAVTEKGRVFELAAELFGVLATPMRLRILSALCDKEKSVSQLLQEIDTTQIAIEMDEPSAVPASERLSPRVAS